MPAHNSHLKSPPAGHSAWKVGFIAPHRNDWSTIGGMADSCKSTVAVRANDCSWCDADDGRPGIELPQLALSGSGSDPDRLPEFSLKQTRASRRAAISARLNIFETISKASVRVVRNVPHVMVELRDIGSGHFRHAMPSKCRMMKRSSMRR